MSKKNIVKILRKRLRFVKGSWLYFLGWVCVIRHRLYFNSNPVQKEHNLNSELIVSLTSYPPRFKYLKRTIESIIVQTVSPDKIVLVIDKGDMDKLPNDIVLFKDRGLEIIEGADIRSFNKLVPVINLYPDAYIVTADDDVYYSPKWLNNLVSNHDGNKNTIVCNVANGIVFDEQNNILPYNEWLWFINDTLSSKFLMPLGVGGVLYSPESLKTPLILDSGKFKLLCPCADDFWFYFMGKLNDANYIMAPFTGCPINWPGSQDIALSFNNTGRFNGISENDVQLHNLIKEFGDIWNQNY